MPGLSRSLSCAARWHARIASVRVASQIADKAFVRQAMADARDIVADSTLPSYQVSAQPPLASGKVRFVGEPVAMVVAPTRAGRGLRRTDRGRLRRPAGYAGVASAQAAQGDFVHEQWRDNVFVTLNVDKQFDELAAQADVVVRRKSTCAWCRWRARRCYWDHQADQLVVVSATQVPHMIRSVLAQCLDLEQGRVRVVSPDVGGAFATSACCSRKSCARGQDLQAAVPLHRGPPRAPDGGRELARAPMVAYADRRGNCWRWTPGSPSTAAPVPVWPFTIGLEPGQPSATCRGRMRSRAIAA